MTRDDLIDTIENMEKFRDRVTKLYKRTLQVAKDTSLPAERKDMLYRCGFLQWNLEHTSDLFQEIIFRMELEVMESEKAKSKQPIGIGVPIIPGTLNSYLNNAG